MSPVFDILEPTAGQVESYIAGLIPLAAAPCKAVVSVLAQVPVMLSVVSVVKRTQHWFERA